MKHLVFLFIISAILIAQACKEDPFPIPDIKGARRVLVEELSGVRCNNCPDGARLIAGLQERNKDKLIVVTIHSNLFGILSLPYSQNDPKPSKYDFRIEDANDLIGYLNVPSGIPAAAVNRKTIPNTNGNIFSINISEWGGLIGEELADFDPAQLQIFIVPSYNRDTRKLDVDINISPDADIPGDHNLTVLITQDSIVDVQKDGALTVENYVHRHILRDIISSPVGDPITEPLLARTLVTKKYTLTLPSEWDDKHCSIVAFVHRNSDMDKEVLQAAEKHVE
jgi:hypothetical protein